MRSFLILFALIIEIWTILLITQWLGAQVVMLWLLVTAILGVWWIRRTGMRTIAEFRSATAAGELPALSLIDALLGLLVGVLLILPGLLTDLLAVGLVLSGMRGRAAKFVQRQMARERPELRQPQQPVIIEGDYRRR